MRFKVLIENTIISNNIDEYTNENISEYICEHGLSIYIEFEDKRILLDAGQSGSFIDNAYRMGVDLKGLDFCVLSHGHYDHSGGFDRFLSSYQYTKIYAMREVNNNYYSASGGEIHYIGLSKEMYNNHKDRFVLLDAYNKLCDNVYILPHSTQDLNKIGERCKLYKACGGEYIPDDFSHELSLIFDTPKGLVIFNSCSHGGIKNIFSEISDRFGNKRIYAFVGGLHMKGSKNNTEICIYSDEEIAEICNYLLEKNISKLYTCHCTGNVAYEKIKHILKDKVEYISTGANIDI